MCAATNGRWIKPKQYGNACLTIMTVAKPAEPDLRSASLGEFGIHHIIFVTCTAGPAVVF